MTASPKYRLKQVPTDIWSIKERLCLASSVLRSGDQNWVSVSRAIRPFGEANRPPDWFSQKNCAIQYSDLLEKVETPKRKRGDRADVETPGNLIVRKLTIERIEELKRIISEEQQRHRKLKQEVEAVKSGCVDDRLEEVWNKIQEEIKLKAAAEASYQKWLQEREAKINAMKTTPKTLGKSKKLFPRQPRVEEVRRNSSQSEQSEQESILDSPLSEPLSVDYFAQVDDVSSPQSTISHLDSTSTTVSTKTSLPNITVCTSAHVSQTPSTSPLLTSLLKSPTPATPISPTITSVLTSPTPQPKEGALPTTQTSPRPISTPQPFFNPTSALATAAARQLAVATAPSSSTSSVGSIFMKDKSHSVNQNITAEGNIPPVVSHSSTSSAPTLSKLLELPPGVPGKLPPLPVIQTEQVISSSVEFSTVSTITTTTVTTSSSPAVTNVVSSVTSETISKSYEEQNSSSNLVSSAEDNENTADTKEDICKNKIDIKIEPASPIKDKEENEVEANEIIDSTEKLVEIKNEIIHTEETEPQETSLKHEVDNDNLEKEVISEKLPEENINEDKEKESDLTCKVEKEEENSLIEEQSSTVITEKEADVISEPSELESASKVINEKEVSSEKILNDSSIQNEKQSVVKEQENEESKKEECKDTHNKEQISETDKLSTEEGKKTKHIEESVKEALVVVESNKVIEELKIIRKPSGKRGRKGRGGRTGRQIQIHEELEDSSVDKKNDKDKTNTTALPYTEVTAKQILNDNQEKHEKPNEVQQPTSKLESINQNIETPTEQILLETKRKPLLSISESIPNSPASTSQSDDQENIKDYRTWKKAIMLVWNAAANHKYANTFLHPVTDDVAPGYHSIVFRPMDLSAIKKNIENGFIKTTMEFQRDMMLMFQNAVMYNSSDHDVFHMAVEMQKEVMEHIQDFLATQLMVQTADTKVLRGREREPRERKSDTDKDDKRKYSYMSDGEPKAKKRRTRE